MALDLSTLKKPAGESDGENFFTVTEANFQSELLQKSAEVPVVALIGSPRSPASEELKSTLRDLAAAGGGKFVVGYVDADSTPQVAQAFGIRDLPTTVALAAGQPLTSFVGTQPRETLQKWVDTLVQQVGSKLPGAGAGAGAADNAGQETPADPRIQVAEEQLATGDIDAAIATYEQVLSDDPDNTPVRQARDTAMVLQRARTDEPAEDDAVGQALHTADLRVVGGDVEGAFDGLIGTITAHVGEDRDRLKERLFELFSLFSGDDPRVLNARTKLASALF